MTIYCYMLLFHIAYWQFSFLVLINTDLNIRPSHFLQPVNLIPPCCVCPVVFHFHCLHYTVFWLDCSRQIHKANTIPDTQQQIMHHYSLPLFSSFTHSRRQNTWGTFVAAALSRCWQMWTQVLQCTCLTKLMWSVSTPTHLQRRLAWTHPQWVLDSTATLVQVQVCFILHQLHCDQYNSH